MNEHNRKIDYLRISVTDRCDLRCVYCMPQSGIVHRPQEEILSFEEIVRTVKIFVSLGITKVRLTGGEVLIRRDIVDLVRSLAIIDGIEELNLTTNGTYLSLYAGQLKNAGVKRINISLDTLREYRFRDITKCDSIESVFKGIDKAGSVGFLSLKLNMVVMKGINDDEIIDFVEFAFSRGITLRFIEFMRVTPLWKEDYFLPIEEVIKACKSRFSLEEIGRPGPGPAVYYKTGQGGEVGFIKTDEANCGACNRLRLTSTGELKSCLYETKGLLLRDLLRNGYSDGSIRDIISKRMAIKQDIGYRNYESGQFYMCSIGG